MPLRTELTQVGVMRCLVAVPAGTPQKGGGGGLQNVKGQVQTEAGIVEGEFQAEAVTVG